MSRALPHAGPPARERRDLLTTILGIGLVVGTGIVLGLQYVDPAPRIIAVFAAVLVIGFAYRLDMPTGIGLLVVALPYPRGTVFGSTSLALILLLLVIWLLRVSQQQAPPLRRTPLDVPLVAFAITWITSFTQIQQAEHVGFALINTQLLAAGLMMFYLVTSNIRTERDLQRLHTFQVASLVTICLLGLYELNHPGARLIPGWIEFARDSGEEFGKRNVRVGGPFFDYELLSEFAALNLLLVAFLFARARTAARRVLFGGVFVLTGFILFATVTRGAMVALAASLLYLTWMLRRRIRLVPFTLLVTAVVAGFIAMNFFVAHYTRSGDLLARFQGTEFQGMVPDSRKVAWQDGWDRWMLRPILGHGPYYAGQIGTHLYLWPHNGYLYIANLVGAIGLGFYLWMLGALWRITRPVVDTLSDPSYARSYLVIAHAQLVLFILDQTKIDFMRNTIYQFQVWMFLATWTTAHLVARSVPSRPGTR